MELRHLRYFTAVAEEQNITRAAVRLHISQPPLSRQIRDLENSLGVMLFERGGKSLRLTAAGQCFLEEARGVLSRADDAVRAIRAFAGGGKSPLRVGYAPSLSVEILSKALRAFESMGTGTRVVLHDLSTHDMQTGLRDGRIDAALMIKPGKSRMPGLEFHELARYAVCVAASPTHPLAGVKSPGLREIFRERLIAYSREDYPEYFQWLESLAAGVPLPAEEHDSATSLVASVEAGRGVALVPETFSCFAGARLTVRKIVPALAPFVVGVAIRKAGKSDSVAAWLRATSSAGRKP